MMSKNFITALISVSCCISISCSKSVADQPAYIVPSPIPIAGRTYSAEEITAFKQLTITATTNSRIAKLPTHVSIYLVDTTYPYLANELDAIISEFNQLSDSNLVLSRTRDRSTSTIQVYLRERDAYLGQEPTAAMALQNSTYTGYAIIKCNEDGIIEHGSAFLDMGKTLGDTLQQRYIIHHEMMHALGLIGHVQLPQFYTILFYYTLTPYILDYTAFDKRMMRLLYNPAVKAGMKEAELNEAVKKL